MTVEVCVLDMASEIKRELAERKYDRRLDEQMGSEGPAGMPYVASTRRIEMVLSQDSRDELRLGDEGPFIGEPIEPRFEIRGSNRLGKQTRNGAIASADVTARNLAIQHGPRIPGRNGTGRA